MRKTDKKIENQLRITLTSACRIASRQITGFQWLTHLVDYSNFPHSLNVICVLDTNDNLNRFMTKNCNNKLNDLIQGKLYEIGIYINNIANHISYDTEENCIINGNGNWKDRLANKFLLLSQ